MKPPRPVELFMRMFFVRCEECSDSEHQTAMVAISADVYECGHCKQQYTLTEEDEKLRERNMTFLGADKRRVVYS